MINLPRLQVILSNGSHDGFFYIIYKTEQWASSAHGGKLLGNLLIQLLLVSQHNFQKHSKALSGAWPPRSVSLILPAAHAHTRGIYGVKTFFPQFCYWVALSGFAGLWEENFLLFHCGIHTAHPTARAEQNQSVKSILKKSSLPNQRCCTVHVLKGDQQHKKVFVLNALLFVSREQCQ